ncbi:alpha/beta hydrolase family esterase [Propionicicella superfundia]|uniref:alpha/beta hydrolase family esterase n=1 Tax=Propionicicella superfundia TaxID=348582 RepID=UPI00146F7177|nr:alpha/beta fold hydrolase [Propionicicella superfundia]
MCAALLLVVGLGGCARAATSSEPGAVPSGTVTVDVAGRPFALYVPAAYRAEAKTALIVALHGYGAQADSMLGFFALQAVADREGFLVATPQGTRDRNGKPFWNASNACCNFGGSSVDDSTYLATVIDAVLERYSVDPGRVYMIGHSNGGFMSYRFACDHADRVAAVASVAGAMDAGADCHPGLPVSALQIHGTDDDVIRYAGGTNNDHAYTSAGHSVDVWRRLDGCSATIGSAGARLDADARVPGADLTPTTWSGCDHGTAVGLWTIDGGSHEPELTGAFATTLASWLDSHGRTG